MNLLFRFLLTVNATSWMLVVYGIKEKVTILGISQCFFGVILLGIPVILSWISIRISVYLGSDSLEGCQEFSLADNSCKLMKMQKLQKLQCVIVRAF